MARSGPSALCQITARELREVQIEMTEIFKTMRFACYLGGGAAAGLMFIGCTASHYRKSADHEAYGIIQQIEASIFHKTNAFTIDTAYAARKPAEILPAELIGSRREAGTRTLTIEGALQLAAVQSRRYQTAKDQLYLSALTLTGERHVFEPNIFGGTAGRLQRSAGPEVAGSLNSQAGMAQALKTGGRLGLSIFNDLLRYYTGDPRRSAVSSISVNLVQPLLRGFGTNNPAVESLTQAERNTVYAVRDFSFFQNDFATEIVNDYFRLLTQKDVVRNRYTNYLARVQLAERMEARSKDREQLNAADQARQAELTAKNNYINQVAAFKNSLDQFKIKLGMTIEEKLYLDDSALEELVTTGLVPTTVPVDRAYRLATETQLLILNSIDRFEDAKRKINVAANRLKAELNILADASWRSETPTDYTKFNPDDIRAGVGIELDLPLDRVRERNTYRATLISFESQLRALTLVLDELMENIERGLRTLEQRRQNYEIQRNALELANRRVASTTLSLQAGRADVRDVSDAQDAQINAENSLVAALVDYQEVRLQLALDIGALDAGQPKFWLTDQISGFLGMKAAAPIAENAAPAPVFPPDVYFKN
jgi:outer membrane protein TolC